MLEANTPSKVERHWVCQKTGAFPNILEQALSVRSKYPDLLKREKQKTNCDLKLIEEHQTHQLGAKLFAKAGFGLFGNEYFEFSNYQVAECITAESRRIHKQMKILGHSAQFNFTIMCRFTDSVFFEGGTDERMQGIIQICNGKFYDIIELKNIFIDSIFYDKKNKYVAWIGNERDEPMIKGLYCLSGSNALWVRRWFKKIIIEVVKHPETRFKVIPKMIQEAYDELESGFMPSKELFTQSVKVLPHEYKVHVRTGVPANLLDRDIDGLINWYETYEDEYVEKKKSWKKEKSYSVKSENINLEEYKHLLLNKLRDTLEIARINVDYLGQYPYNSSSRE